MSTTWGYGVAPGEKFCGRKAGRNYESGCFRQQRALKPQKSNLLNIGVIGRLIVRIYLIIYLFNVRC